MSLIRKHGAVLQAWACLDLVLYHITDDRHYLPVIIIIINVKTVCGAA